MESRFTSATSREGAAAPAYSEMVRLAACMAAPSSNPARQPSVCPKTGVSVAEFSRLKS
jgi:hypothetical protein